MELAAVTEVVSFLYIFCVWGYLYILNNLGLLTGGYRGHSQSGTRLESSKMKNRLYRRSIIAVIASFFIVGEMLGKARYGLKPISLKWHNIIFLMLKNSGLRGYNRTLFSILILKCGGFGRTSASQAEEAGSIPVICLQAPNPQ